MSIKTALLAATVLTATAGLTPAFSQPTEELLQKAQEAENQRYWSAAEGFYRQVLQRNPNRADLWERLGDIIAAEGRPKDAADAFARAANLASDDLRLQVKAAQAFSGISEPQRAGYFWGRAVDLDSSNSLNWLSKSVNESWAGNYSAAENSLQQAFNAGLPRTPENLVRLATLQQWQDKHEQASQTLDAILAQDPNNPDALLGVARLYGWQGNYHKALKYLKKFKENGGDDLVYSQETALILAWGDKPDESLRISDTALQNHPGDRNLGIGQVVAFFRARDFDTAFDILEGLEADAAGPDPELAEIRRRISAPLRSNIELTTGFSTDRDNIDIIGGRAVYSQALDRGTFLRFGIDGRYLKADRFSGLDRVDNGERITKTTVWGEVETDIAKNVWGSLRVGGSFTNFTSANKTIPVVGANITVRADDDLWIKFGYNRDHFLISPRALSLGLIRNEEYIEFVWVPDPRYFIQLRLSAFQNNDTNREKRADLTIIRAISRTAKLKVDAGFNAVWYGYKFRLGNGYYDPDFYQRYLFPLYFTIKISDDDNVVLTLAPGMQKDETFGKFHFSGVGTLETTHGLFNDWMLKTKWSVYVGGSESALMVAPATDYWVVAGNISIFRRF